MSVLRREGKCLNCGQVIPAGSTVEWRDTSTGPRFYHSPSCPSSAPTSPPAAADAGVPVSSPPRPTDWSASVEISELPDGGALVTTKLTHLSFPNAQEAVNQAEALAAILRKRFGGHP